MHSIKLLERMCVSLALLLALGVWLLAQPLPVRAATIVVNTAVDENDGSCADGDCSLRDAVTVAAAGDTINFSGNMTIYLQGSEILIMKSLTIDGGSYKVTIDGSSATGGASNGGVFTVFGTVTFNHLNIVNGVAEYGGGVFVGSSTTLTLRNCTLSGNRGNTYGGAAYNFGTLVVQNSTLSGNSSPNYGGGIYNDGGTVTAQNSTIANNSSPFNGAGVHNNGGTFNYQNTLIADNGGTYSTDCYGGTIGTNLYNWVEKGGCGAAFSGDPALGPLADNGGNTRTHALAFNSGAIDRIPNGTSGCGSVLPQDQRGANRPQPTGGACDIGAYEAAPRPLWALTKTVTPAADVDYHGLVTYTLRLTNTGNLSGNVALTDTLPAGVSFTQWIANPGAVESGGVITWSGSIAAAANRVFRFQATHTGAWGDVIVNTATFSGALQSGTAQATFVVEKPVLQLTKTVTPTADVPAANGTVTYTLVFKNTGDADDAAAQWRDALPPGVTFARWLANPGATVQSNTLTWDGALTAGATLTFTFAATHTGALGALVVNTAHFTGTLQTGSAQATFAVEKPVLQLKKTVTPATAPVVNGVVTYSLVISNTGIAADPAVSLRDALPTNVTFARWLTNPGASVNDNVITWSGGMPVNTALTFTFAATVTNGVGTVVNTARFTGTVQTGAATATFTAVCLPEIVVTNANDAGAGSLRQAIADTCAGGRVTFADDETIYLASTLTVDKRLTIDGSGHAITLSGDTGNDGSRNVRVMQVNAGQAVTLSHLAVISGTANDGGGLYNAGTLVAQAITVTDNVATYGWDGGGGIHNAGTLTLTGSVVARNSASAGIGGGILNDHILVVEDSLIADNDADDAGGGLYQSYYAQSMDIRRSTISGNDAHEGGGFYYYKGTTHVTESAIVNNSGYTGGGIKGDGVMVMENSTVSGNTAAFGGGIYHSSLGTLTLNHCTIAYNTNPSSSNAAGISNGGTLHYQNTLIANNTGYSNAPNCSGGTIGTHSNNWVADGTCGATFSGDPRLVPLADNGGPSTGSGQGTLTHALSPFSLAIDAVPVVSCTLTTDQRGAARPQNAACDVGALEMTAQPLYRFSYSVPPAADVPYYGGVITYTLVLTNVGSADETAMRFTTTLPENVTVGGWVTPTDGLAAQNTLTWTGAIPAGAVRRLVFTATHEYGLQFANTVYFSNTAHNQPLPVSAVAGCAPVFEVRNGNDSGRDSLRQGLADVCPGGLITFTQDTSIYLNNGLATAKSVTIDGSSHAITLSGDTGNDGSRNVRILNIGAGHAVTLSHLSIVSGTADSGGGIYNAGILTMNVLTLTGNLANNGFNDNHGGALYNAGTVQAHDSRFANNQAYSIYSNRYGRGGGVYNAAGATMTLTHCTIAGNQILHYNADGGGVYSAGALTLQDCTIADNQAVNGNGLFNTGMLWVSGSTFSGNIRYSYYASYGGALNHAGGAAWIQNSTFSGNRATYGGGIYNTSALTVQNSTLSGNETIYYDYGGGLRLESGAAYLYNSIIANSAYGDCAGSGSILANVHNLIEDGSCGAAFSGDPQLGPLADNDGETLTHALLPTSLAIDAGDPATCLAADQRGVTRPQNSVCDIGAVEAPPQPVVRIAKTVTPTLAPYHGVVTYTLTLTNTGAASDTRARLTDALPAGVAFGGWIAQNGALEQNHAITWTGTLAPSASLSLIFTATHQTALQVANTAIFSGTAQQRQATATFNVACQPTFTVQNSNDSGMDSLRQAIADVCPGGGIAFAEDTTVYLSSELVIAKGLTIDGSGHAVTLSGDSGNDGSRNVRVLNIAAGYAVTLSHLSIVSGYSWGNGAGVNNAGYLTLTGCTFSNHDGSYGGALYNTGDLTLTACLFTNNDASYGGGIRNLGQVTAVNSTFSGNTAYEGGGIHSTGVMTLTHLTLVDNLASNSNRGSGIRQAGGALYIYNTLMARGGRGGDCYVSDASVIRTNVNNWVADGTCSDNGVNFGSGDPLLDPLSDNGGDTLTHALPVSSPAVDAAEAAFCPPTDQRGRPRPVGAGCDIGAYELGPLHLTYTVTPTTDAPYHGLVTYTLALANTGAVDEADLWVTATLPAEVLMAGWIVSPSNTSADGNAVYWHGNLAIGEIITISFLAQHTGDYADVVVSEARFTSATDVGRTPTTFTVECAPAYQVTTAADSGVGSLRNALAGTCDGGIVSFAGDTTIYLSSTLTISRGVTVDGSGRAITVSGDSGHDGTGNVTVFYVTASDPVTLSHLSIISGAATLYGYGGGILNMGDLRLLDSTLADNQADAGGALVNAGVLTMTRCTLLNNGAKMGGGILAYGGTLNVQDSTLAYNQASDMGGAVYNYYGNLTFQNSTLSHNTAENDGGGIHNEVGVITLTHTTLADNTVITTTGSGGGFYQNGGALFAYHTLIANSVVSGTEGSDCVIAGGVISASVNILVEDGSCGATVSGDPVLGPLQDNGGATWTRALLAGSPAIDAIPALSCTLTTDQRGMPRPYPTGGVCDIGAYEAYPALSLTKSVTPTTDVTYHGTVTYTLVLSNGGAATETQAALRDMLPPGVTFGAWIITPTGTLRVGNSITWDGELAASAALTWRFTALHIGDYGDVITNTATFSGTQTGSAAAAFNVAASHILTVGLDGNHGGSVSSTPDGIACGATCAALFADGAEVALTATPLISSTFTGWSGAATTTANPLTLTLDMDKTITATFTLNRYIITPTAGAGGNINPATPQMVDYGGSQAFSITPDTGYHITEVRVDGVSVSVQGAYTFTNITANHTLGATFAPNEYTLTIGLVGQGAVTRVPSQTTYLYGDVVTLTATPAPGWYFGQWGGDASGTFTQTTVTMTAARTVTATFTSAPPTYYTLIMEIVGSGAVTPSIGAHNYLSGTLVDLSASPADGWQFNGWSGTLESGANPAAITMDGNKAITVTFSLIPVTPTYTLTAHQIGLGTVTLDPPGGVYDAGTSVTLTATPEAAWYFGGWTGDLNTANIVEHLVMDSPKVVTATFTQEAVVTHTLTVTVVGQGTIVPMGGVYADGVTVTLAATPDTGWQFESWSGAATGTLSQTQVVMDTDKIVTATFARLTDTPQIYLPLMVRTTMP